MEALRQREQVHATRSLTKELGLAHYAPLEGEQISGTFTQTTHLASGKYAIVQRAQEFTLVPWRLNMEQPRSKAISGTATAHGIEWEWGPRRGIGR